MKVRALALFAASLLHAGPAVALKAQSDFERVSAAPRPPIADSEACLQSQAAALALSPPEERSLLYYRKGYCAFAAAAATRDPGQFLAAAAEFDRAIASWPAHARQSARSAPPEPVPPALRLFAVIARLHAAAGMASADGALREFSPLLASQPCNSYLMPATFCPALWSAAAQWLGGFALPGNQLDGPLSAPPNSGWDAWARGRLEFHRAAYAAAAVQYAQAIDRWKQIWQGPGPTLSQALAPPPRFAPALSDLGGARLLAGDLPGAILALDASLQADPASPHALFLRARAHELAGHTDAALADYNLAGRTAFALSRDLASGEAHLYRGIVLFRRGDFARAEDEFSSALNFQISAALRPDARAWRHLAAVAGGSCASARHALDLALATVSPFFPQSEARSLAAACGGA